jgi:low temperature requirement protein LtrA
VKNKIIAVKPNKNLENKKYNIWWGPPKKFSVIHEDRKISWLELFYDLVYVIAISRITHHLAINLDLNGLIDYIYLFGMIFWGWFNGSFHHDMHGSTGLRTNLMTLWQMIIVAALIVTLNSPPTTLIFNVTIALMVMQIFITYLWWSVGIYDKTHRQLNRPYTICFLISFALIALSLFLSPSYLRILFFISLLFNFLPPFLIIKKSKSRAAEFSLSSSMTERFGLFTIILFGETVSGAITGVSEIKELSFQNWINFGLVILIIFAIWWIFFKMIADRKCKQGYFQSYLMTLIYIPSLMALGMIGVAFSGMFMENFNHDYFYWIKITFGASLGIFLSGIIFISQTLDYPNELISAKAKWQRVLSFAALFFILFPIFNFPLSLFAYLAITFITLIITIIIISKNLLIVELKQSELSEG